MRVELSNPSASPLVLPTHVDTSLGLSTADSAGFLPVNSAAGCFLIDQRLDLAGHSQGSVFYSARIVCFALETLFPHGFS